MLQGPLEGFASKIDEADTEIVVASGELAGAVDVVANPDVVGIIPVKGTVVSDTAVGAVVAAHGTDAIPVDAVVPAVVAAGSVIGVVRLAAAVPAVSGDMDQIDS